MPMLAPCRRPYCPDYAVSDGWCRKHWRPLYGTDTAMPTDWPTVRRTVLRRDGQRCQLCGVHGTHVDHIRPRSAGGSNHPSNLRTLCERCHRRETGRTFGLA